MISATAKRGEIEHVRTIDEAIENIKLAVKSKSVAFGTMEASFKLLEKKAGKKSKLSEVEGKWELVFSTAFQSGYLPVAEIFSAYPSSFEARLDSSWGLLPIGSFIGSCSWNAQDSSLSFSFNQIKFGPFTFNKKTDEKRYTFFWIKDEVAIARTSAGGFTLLERVSQ